MAIKKITLISTSLNTGALMNKLFAKELPEISIHNIVDDGLVKEIIANDNVVSPSLIKRVCMYVVSAEMSGTDLVMITCSTISGITEVVERLVGIPVIRIDEPMAELAVKKFDRIKLLATMASTLNPSVKLIKEKARKHNKKIILDYSLCESARKFLDEGNQEKHDRILREEIENALKDFDLVILAQASMDRLVDKLDTEKRKRVIASPTLAIENIKRMFLSG